MLFASGCGSLAKGRPEPPYDRELLRDALNGTSVAESSDGADLTELLQIDEGDIYAELVALTATDDKIVTQITTVFATRNIRVAPPAIDRVRVLLVQISAPAPGTNPTELLRDVIAEVKIEHIGAVIAADTENEYPRIVQIIRAFYATPKSNSARRQDLRDEIIDLSLILINLEFTEFVSEISVKSKAINAGSTIASIGADVAATLVAPASTVRLLAAISGGIEASRVTINKEYLYEETTRVLISQMNAQREVVFQDIAARGKLPIGKYTMAQALHDIDRYYNAGTIDGAFAAIQKNAGAQQQAAEVLSEEAIRKDLVDLSNSSAELRTLFAKMRPKVVRGLVAGLYDVFKPQYTGFEDTVKSTVRAYVVKDSLASPPTFFYTDAEIASLGATAANKFSVDVNVWIRTLATPDQLATLVQSKSISNVAPAFTAAVRGAAEKSVGP